MPLPDSADHTHLPDRPDRADGGPYEPVSFEPAVQALRELLFSDGAGPLHLGVARLRQAISFASASRRPVLEDKGLVEFGQQLTDVLLKFSPSSTCQVQLEWWGKQQQVSMEGLVYRERAASILAAGVLAFGSRLGEGPLAQELLAAATGVDPLSVALGDLLTDKPLFPEFPPLPPGLPGFRDLEVLACAGEIRRGLAGFAVAGTQRPEHLPGAAIVGIDPGRGCAGDTVTIRGTGFGASQPADVTVLFPGRAAETAAATVMYWTDTAITVVVPAGVGHGCVRLVRTPSGFGEVYAAGSALAGALETCFGPGGSRAGRLIRDFTSKVVAYVPPCSGPQANFIGGPPIIDSFLIDQRPVASVGTRSRPTLSWNVSGADTLEILTVGPRPAPVPGPGVVLQGTGQWSMGLLALQDGDRFTLQLRASNACGSVTARVDLVCRGKQALMLAGGGTKAAFEVGAVQCLYDVRGFRPDIIVGASAGALNAAKLAEGPAALPQLRAMWLALQDEPDFFIREPWFALLEAKLQEFLGGSTSNVGFAIGSRVGSMAADKILGALVGAMGVPGWVYTVVTSLYPAVTTVIDVVRLIDAVSQAVNANALFSPAPLASLIANNISAARISQSGIELRIGMISLETGQEELVTERGSMLSSGFLVPMDTALLAAVAIPIAFPPVQVSPTPRGTEHFIDGGTRNNIPFRAAAEAGADRIVGIMPSPRGMAFKPFGGAKLIDIAPRALEVLLDEVQEDDIAPYRGFGVPIELASPTFLVHNTLTVDPGFISINMDYGWMRAYDDLVAPATQRTALRRLSDELTTARVDAWALEHQVNGERVQRFTSGIVPIPDPLALVQLRTAKMQIRALAAQRRSLGGVNALPLSTERWWQQFERHKWIPFIPGPWDSLSSRLGSLPAAPVPLPL